jgi:hypothetical protein
LDAAARFAYPHGHAHCLAERRHCHVGWRDQTPDVSVFATDLGDT